MANIKSVPELQKRIRTLVKEEVAAALREDINPQFRKVYNKKEFSAWLVRQFFSHKSRTKIWYDPSVNETNVLEKISELTQKGVFPATPKALVSTWNMKGQLNKAMGEMDREEKTAARKAAKADSSSDEDKVKYKTGEVSLRDIGQELGGVTPTMINKLGAKAMEDFKTLNFGKRPETLTPAEKNQQFEQTEQARHDAAEEFAELLHNSASVEEFLNTLKRNMVLSPMDLKTITPEELDGLEILKEKDPERAKLILIQDIEEDDNLFKSYQSAVYRKIFPAGKRGRPKKVVD